MQICQIQSVWNAKYEIQTICGIKRIYGGFMDKQLLEMTLEELWKLFPISLTEHKIYWSSWYEEEEKYLLSLLLASVKIYHIGSTAVSKIWAKPIIDILVETDINVF